MLILFKIKMSEIYKEPHIVYFGFIIPENGSIEVGY